MSTPVKPWASVVNSNRAGGSDSGYGGGSLGSQIADVPSVGGVIYGSRPIAGSSISNSTPPPLPPRLQPSNLQPTSRPMNSYSSYGMPMSPYNSYSGYGGYGTMGGYGGFGSYPRRIGGYGMGYGGYQEEYDSFMMQSIDESCQSLFGPFDALVRSINSIAMVLDSTHQAMQFSFRTVLSAADSLSKLKNMLIGLASSFSLIRLIRTLYYKVLRFLGLISGKTMTEKQWAEVFNQAGASANPPDANMAGAPSPWMALGFFTLMMGGPYLMFKLFAQNIKHNKPKNGLVLGQDNVDVIAAYDFEAGSPQELSIKKGERLKVAKTNNQGWTLASNGTDTGYVPINRIKLVNQNYQSNLQLPNQRYFAQLPGLTAKPINTAPTNVPEVQDVTNPGSRQPSIVSSTELDPAPTDPNKERGD